MQLVRCGTLHGSSTCVKIDQRTLSLASGLFDLSSGGEGYMVCGPISVGVPPLSSDSVGGGAVAVLC